MIKHPPSESYPVGRQWIWFFIVMLLPFFYLMFFLIAYKVDIPYWDEWNFVPFLGKYYQGTLNFYDLWEQCDAHRFIIPRSIRIVLAGLTHWNQSYELAVNLILIWGAFYSMGWLLRASMRSMGDNRIPWIIPVVSLMFFSPAQGEYWLTPESQPYFFNIFSVVVGIIVLSRPLFKWSRFIWAVFLGFVATFSFSNGLLYWILGVFILCFSSLENQRRRRIAIGIWMIVGVFAFFLYFLGYKKPHFQSDALTMFTNLPHCFYFVLSYLGSPLGAFGFGLVKGLKWLGFSVSPIFEMANHLAFLIGIFGLVGVIFTCWSLMRICGIQFRNILPYISIMLYAIGSGVMTSVGRMTIGLDRALDMRYIAFSSLFWISVILLMYLHLLVDSNPIKINCPTRSLSKKRLIIASLGVVTMLATCNLAYGTVWYMSKYYLLLPVRQQLLSASDELLERCYPNASHMRERLKILEKYKLRVFRGT